jgi:gas vesicle protein
MTEPKSEKLTRTLNQLIEEYGIRTLLEGLADHCLKEAKFLEADRSTDLAQNWQKLGEDLQDVVDDWGRS